MRTLKDICQFLIIYIRGIEKDFSVIYRIVLIWVVIDFMGGIIMEVLKVSAQSQPKSVAGALAAVLRENCVAEVQAVGAGAVNQAVKAIAITRGFVAPNGIDLVVVPAFSAIEIDGEERTAIKFIVEPR